VPVTREPVHLTRVEFASVVATERTEWTFARIHDAAGASADVELTSGDDTCEVVRLVTDAAASLKGGPIASEADVPAMLGLDERRLRRDLALATAVSTLRTGVSVIQAANGGVSLTEALGGQQRDSVPLYANINRGLFATPRTPSDFAAAAERAVRGGFRAVKCAPFDEVGPEGGTDEAVRLARPGIRRAAAVRDAVGPDVTLLVDCHSRFDIESAVIVAEELAELGIDWFEEPVQPTEDSAGLARIAARVPVVVAGGEKGYGEKLFADLIARGAVEVIMPDIKYCGGVAVAARSGMAAIEAGGGVSLHSPSGPVSLLASGHVTAAMPGAMPLEYAVYEADWRADLLTPPERVEDGRLRLNGNAGLGAQLSWDLLRRVGRVWHT
jgi:galactonate dehydratase